MGGVLLFGQFDSRELEVIHEAAQTAGMDLLECTALEQAATQLDTAEPEALLVHADQEEPLALAVHARARTEHGRLPIIGLERRPGDLNFANALNWGVDDVSALESSWPLVTRLRSVLGSAGPPSIARRGVAVVSETEEGRRYALARALRSAGFEVRYTYSPSELETAFQDESVGLFVFSSVHGPDPKRLIEQASNGLARCIISAEPRAYHDLADQFREHERARVMNATSPPENVIFLANELANPQALNKRASPRELYSTVVRFRPAGHDEDDVGFTYNVSLQGVYVRTLAAPSQDHIWLELTPPRTTRRVRLEGEIAWRRPYGPNHHATVPSGFGVKLTDGSATDLAAWKEGVGAPPAAVALQKSKHGP